MFVGWTQRFRDVSSFTQWAVYVSRLPVAAERLERSALPMAMNGCLSPCRAAQLLGASLLRKNEPNRLK